MSRFEVDPNNEENEPYFWLTVKTNKPGRKNLSICIKAEADGAVVTFFPAGEEMEEELNSCWEAFPGDDGWDEKVRSILGPEYEVHDNYSGRGMFGKVSEFAFTANLPPDSAEGEKLLALGFTYDRMGMGWIYYIK